MRAGLLRDQVSFEQRTITVVNGQNVITWATVFNAVADIQRLSELSHTFIVRYRSGITPADYRILSEGRRWTITAALPDKKRTLLTINCDGSDLIETSHFQSTEREYIDGLEQERPSE